jgi:hypothetical protein
VSFGPHQFGHGHDELSFRFVSLLIFLRLDRRTPASQGGDRARASQVYGVSVRHGAYGLLMPASPAPAPSTEVAEAEVLPVDGAISEPDEQWTATTITDVDGALGWRGSGGSGWRCVLWCTDADHDQLAQHATMIT